MGEIFRTAVTAAGLFAGTNIDDVIVLAVLFLSGRARGAPKPWQVWAGQASGFTVLVVISLAAALGLTIIPDAWVGLLGFIPLALGLWGLAKAVRAHRTDGQGTASPASGLLSVVTLTIVNGSDNLAVYPAVFRTAGAGSVTVTLVVFAVGVVAWCLLGSWLGSHKKVISVVERWGHWIVPAVFIAIGAIILASSGVVTRVL